MPSFSNRSKSRLATCHPKLQALMNEVIKKYDCSIIEGHRTKDVQDEYFTRNVTKVRWPDSKHNKNPSRAVDVVPYIKEMGGAVFPQPNESTEVILRKTGACYMFLGYVKRVAEEMGIRIRFGADWDSDTNLLDQQFHDLPHIELHPDE
jgi:peptidoglycan L-alanyl-D-glutamate endopeptidase CwlK